MEWRRPLDNRKVLIVFDQQCDRCGGKRLGRRCDVVQCVGSGGFLRHARRYTEANGRNFVVLSDRDTETGQMVVIHELFSMLAEGGGVDEIHRWNILGRSMCDWKYALGVNMQDCDLVCEPECDSLAYVQELSLPF
jgi:hypothetical protein